MSGQLKYLLVFILVIYTGRSLAQPYPFNGYTLYDHLVSAIHPNGCPATYVTGWPDDSTWVNMLDNTVMTGYFGYQWTDLPGNDLLLESSFHHDNYSVRLILEDGSFSSSFVVDEDMWTDLPFIQWKHIFPGCVPGQAASPQLLLPLDFVVFGIIPGDIVVGIEITFLPTVGQADFAGAYIIVPPCGMFALDPDTTICPGETVTIDATMPNATYLWQDGFTGPVYTNAGPGTYWVEVTIYDCSIVDTLRVSEHPPPPPLGNDTLLCTGQTLLLDVTTPDAIYEWQDQSNESTFNVITPGAYSVTVTIDDCVYEDEIEVEYLDPPSISLGNDTTLCENTTLILNAFIPGASYEWQDNTTSSTFTVTDPGEYSVVVNVSGCTTEDAIEVSYTYPEPVNLGIDVILCDGESLFLDAFIFGATYLWQDNSTNSGLSVIEPGIYSVSVTKDNCTTTDEIEVDFVSAIHIDLGNDTILCTGESIILDAFINGATYEWQDQSIAPTFNVIAPGEYSVNIVINGCTVSDTIHVAYADGNLVTLGPDTILCPGETMVLEANTPGVSYQWQDQSDADTFMVTLPGKYWVTVTLNGCEASDTIIIMYAALASVDLGNDTTLCSGETLLLNVQNNGAAYLWQDNSTTSTLLVETGGMYWVNVSENICTVRDTIQVTYNNVTPINLGNDTSLCEGATLLLEVNSANAVFEWQDQSTGTTLQVTTPGLYWVTAQVGDCSLTDTIYVDYLSTTSIDLGNDTTLCEGQTINLDAGITGESYLWQDQSTGPTMLVTQPGNYWVQVSTGNCMGADSVMIDYAPFPVVDLGHDTTLCQGESLLLDASTSGAAYHWQDNSSFSFLSAMQPGMYWVIVNIDACYVSDTILIDYYNLTVNLGNDTTLCAGQELLLDATTPGGNYQWQDASTQPELLVSDEGQYIVIVKDGICMVSDTINIAYLHLSSINLGNDTVLCNDQTLTLVANAPGAQYVWQDQSIGQEFNVTQSGFYWVEVSLADCDASDTIHVDFADPVSVNIGADTILCPGETLTLLAETFGASYQWQDESDLATYDVGQAGTFYVIVDVKGCIASDSITVDYVSLPLNILGNDTTLCEGEILLLDASTPQGSYSWQDHSTDPVFIVDEAGTFTVNVTLHTCTTRDTMRVEYLHAVIVDLGPDQLICAGETLLLDPHIDETAEYLWQDHQTTSTYTVSNEGKYWLSVIHACGESSDTIVVDMDQCDCQISLPNVISPNGDNTNDTFTPNASCGLNLYRLQIFDRAGGLMFNSNEPGEEWDGTMNGLNVQVGVYVYLLEYAFEDGKARRMSGDLTIVR